MKPHTDPFLSHAASPHMQGSRSPYIPLFTPRYISVTTSSEDIEIAIRRLMPGRNGLNSTSMAAMNRKINRGLQSSLSSAQKIPPIDPRKPSPNHSCDTDI